MFVLFAAGVLVAWWARQRAIRSTSISRRAADGNMEGKEVRFGIFNSALFATITTDASCGAVNAMHDSFTPLGGLVPMFNMETGEVIFGGVARPLRHAHLRRSRSVHRGLMVGRTPEYLGKKIEAYDVKLVMIVLMCCRDDPRLQRLGRGFALGQAGLNNSGPTASANPLRVQLVRGQQRQRLRRSDRKSCQRRRAL